MEYGKVTVSDERTIDIADYEKKKIYECISLPVMAFKTVEGEMVMEPLDLSQTITEKKLRQAINNTVKYCREKITNDLDKQEHSIREWASQFQEIELIKKSPLITPIGE